MESILILKGRVKPKYNCFHGDHDKMDTTNSESDLHDKAHFINKKKHI